MAEADQAVHRLKSSKLLTNHGILTGTVTDTSEQWDAPNMWAPLQHIIVEGLRLYNYTDLSADIAIRFLTICYRTYHREGVMYEKYTNTDRARGGEYEVQVGFGWTNGVVLDFINRLDDFQLQRVVAKAMTETTS